MLKLFAGGSAIALAAALVVGTGADDSAGAERVGYFKSDGGNRVMAYTASGELSEAEARHFLGKAMHSPGRLTFAVLYSQGAVHPGDRLTSAPDYLTAVEMLDSVPYDGWAWGVVINAAGNANFDLR